MTQKANGQHVVAIDLVRFFAAVLVLFTHLGYDIAVRPESPSHKLSGGTISVAVSPELSFYGWIGVQIFFVISGIVITYSANGLGPYDFFRSRVLRLVPAAWLCSTLTLLALAYHHGYVPTDVLRGYRHSIFFLPWAPWIDHVFWTLAVEIPFYSMVGILIYKQRVKYIEKLAANLAWVCLVYWLLFSIAKLEYSPPLTNLVANLPYWAERFLTLLLVKHGAFFTAGIYICAVFIDQRRRPTSLILTVMLSACVLKIYWANVYANGPLDNPFWPAVGLWLGSVAVILAGIRYNAVLRRSAPLVRLLRVLGLMTYPLYLLHQNIGAVVIGRLRLSGVEPLPALLISSLLVLALSYAVVTLAEPTLKRWLGAAMDLGRVQMLRLRG